MQQQRHATRDFTNWLSSYVKGKKNDPVKKEVEKLGTLNGEISQLMVKASKLISKNANRFNIPLEKNKTTEKDVYKVLYMEWNIYHQSTATGNALSLEHTKNQLYYSSEKGHQSYRFTDFRPKVDHTAKKIVNTSLPSSCKVHPTIIPLIGGIAIGAP